MKTTRHGYLVIAPGSEVGHYRILERLGEGGMGIVYVAEHMALERRVAVKVLRPELAKNPEVVARFFNEARAVNRIGHEHIVDVTDFGITDDGETYFVMELLAGETLAQRLRQQGAFGWQRAVRVALQVARALTASHRVSIVHRDLKPDNVLLIRRDGDEDYVKLLDFGIAKLLGDGEKQRHKTRSGAVIGTPHYMSPEQALGHPVDHRTDIYALGVILYEMVTGEVPFDGLGWGEIMLKHATHSFPSASARRPQVPAAFDAVLLRAVSKEREARHPSMEELSQALQALLGSAPAVGVALAPTLAIAPDPAPPVPINPTVSLAPPVAEAPGTSGPSAQGAAGAGRLAVWAGAAAMVAVGITLWAIWPMASTPAVQTVPPSLLPSVGAAAEVPQPAAEAPPMNRATGTPGEADLPANPVALERDAAGEPAQPAAATAPARPRDARRIASRKKARTARRPDAGAVRDDAAPRGGRRKPPPGDLLPDDIE